MSGHCKVSAGRTPPVLFPHSNLKCVLGPPPHWSPCLHASALFSSISKSCPILCNPMDCSTPGLPVHYQLKLMSIEPVMPSSHLILCHPLLLPSVFPSIRVFSNESVLHIRWPKYWRFSIGPSNEYSGLIMLRSTQKLGFPDGASGKEPDGQRKRHKRCRFTPWIRKIPWRRAWQSTPAFLTGDPHG